MDKIQLFNKLKQQYSPLGLGDEILSAHADSLLATGLITDENADTVVEGQKIFLEQLQRANDRRAGEASRTAREKAMAEFNAEQAKKEEQAKVKAKEEADKKKADEEAAKAKADAEEQKKREEEERQKAAEEDARQKAELEQAQISDVVKKMLAERDEQTKAAREAAQKAQNELLRRIEQMTKDSESANQKWAEQFESLKKLSEQQASTIKTMEKEREEQKAQEVLRLHREKINTRARELGIPQYRIDEGFTLADDADDDTITNHLTKVANNIKAMQTPGTGERAPLNDGKTMSREEMDQIAASMVK